MKKFIIAAAIILTSGVTALSLSRKEEKVAKAQVKVEKSDVDNKSQFIKSDIATAD